jgi:phage gp36-like protein
MSNFISINDYDSSIHREILDELVREDEAIIEICEDEAIAQMKGYLQDRYDMEAMFPAAPQQDAADTRNPLVLMMAKDIAIYHIFTIHNPQKMSQIRKDRYDRAIEWLKQVNKGDILIADAKEVSAEDMANNSHYQLASNIKRNNHC